MNLQSPQFENQSLRKEFIVFPANSQSKAFPLFKAVILSLFICFFSNREANMTAGYLMIPLWFWVLRVKKKK